MLHHVCGVLCAAVARIALVKPEKARNVENMILAAAQRGALQNKVCSEARPRLSTLAGGSRSSSSTAEQTALHATACDAVSQRPGNAIAGQHVGTCATFQRRMGCASCAVPCTDAQCSAAQCNSVVVRSPRCFVAACQLGSSSKLCGCLPATNHQHRFVCPLLLGALCR